MVPLEVTHTALVTPAVLAAMMAASSSTFTLLMQQLLLFFASTYRAEFGFEHPPLHDPCAVAYVIAPQLFQVRACRWGGVRCQVQLVGVQQPAVLRCAAVPSACS
jgi:inosine-uridine nucleoside N-ribohydrolase